MKKPVIPSGVVGRIVLCSLFLFILWSPAVYGQVAGTGGISGTIADPTGAVIPGAQVALTSASTGVVQTATANAAGQFAFISLNPGTYSVKVSHKGFQTSVHTGIDVTVDETVTVNFKLQLGSVSQVVKVSGAAGLAATTNSTVGELISSKTIQRVPLLNRNVYNLVQLSPGVTPANGTPNSSESQAIISISNGRPGINVSSYTFNGAIQGSVYYMLDGSPVGVAENNAAAILPAFQPPEDAIQEVRVETQNTPASYESGPAGVISLVTKSGGAHFHGDLFGVFRPDILAANEYFNKQSQILANTPNTPPSFHRYQEGAAIGGPVVSHKLFFFVAYEATQQALFDSSNVFTVPTTAERTGDFSNDSFTIYDPLLPDLPDGNRQPFPGNIISNPNPIALKMLSEMPKCNYPNPATCDSNTSGAVNNFYKPGVDPSTAQDLDFRLDLNQSEKQHIFGRYTFVHSTNKLVNAFGNMWDPFYAQNITNAWNMLLGDDYTFNSNTMLQARASFTRHRENQGGDPAQNGYDITKLGFPASLAAEEVYKILPTAFFDDVGGGVGGTGNWNTFQYASENADFNVSVTRVQGKHQISTGFEYMKRYMNVGQPPAPSGNYYFDVSATDQNVNNYVGGSDFASFLIGMGEQPGYESYNFTKDLFVAESNPYYGAFVQDTYRASDKLSITAGLRWDVFVGRNERHNRLEYFNPTVAGSSNGVSYNGAEIYVNGNHRSPFSVNLGNVGPRLGFTWQPLTRVVVRGGAGIYYGPSPEMVASGGLNSDGFSSVTNWNSTCYNADGNTIYNGTSGCAGAVEGSPAPSVTGVYSLSNPFPNGVVPIFKTPPSGLANNLGTTLNTVLHTERTPTVYNYNFGIEYKFPRQVVVSLAYVGSHGLFLPMGSVDINQLSIQTIQRYGASLCVYPSDPACKMVPNKWEPILPATNANYGSSTVPLWVSLQEFPQFGNGSYGAGNGVMVNGDPIGNSEYNSLQLKLQKRLTHHFTTLDSFTWAKLLTDDGNPPLGFVGSHGGYPQDFKDLQYEHAVSPQDVKYQFTGQVSYDLPIGPGRAVNLQGVSNAVLGGWTVNGIVYLSSGIPIPGPSAGLPNSYFNQRADMTCNPSNGAPRNSTTWFNASCFALPSSPFNPGTSPAYMDHMRTMGARDLDMSLYKSFPMGADRNLRLDISSYNLTNTAQFGMPNVPSIEAVETQPSVAATFGQITNTVNSPRQYQFGVKFTF